jgi:hypothetical protein
MAAFRWSLNVIPDQSDGDEPAIIDFPIHTCNSRRINVAIGRDGTIDWAWLSTAVGCPTVTTTE